MCLVLADRVRDIEITMAERDRVGAKVWTVMVALLGVSLVHMGLFLIWVGAINSTLDTVKLSDQVQNTVIREMEREMRQ